MTGNEKDLEYIIDGYDEILGLLRKVQNMTISPERAIRDCSVYLKDELQAALVEAGYL